MQVEKLKIFVTVYLIASIECGPFKSSIEKLKNKAKHIYNKKRDKDKTLNFWGHEKSEYPGSNSKLREENKAKWDMYYACINDQNESFGSHGTVTPEAILGFEGSFVKLDCKVCLSPEESQNRDSVTWDWAALSDDSMKSIEYTDHILLSPDDKSLNIFNLRTENSGQYKCSLGESATAPYFLTVTNMSETGMSQVHNKEAPVGPYPKEPEILKDDNIVIHTEWGEWSACSKCNQIGKKHRLGYCNIFSQISEKTEESSTNRTKKALPDKNLEMFKIFKNGIPCQSHILPNFYKDLPQVAQRKNEIMTGYCNIKCSETKVFEVKNKHGEIIETANNSAGIFSLLQGMPPLEPPIERRLQYAVKGKDVVLECPGNINSDAPIEWQIGEKKLIPEIISKESNGRIYISITDKIHINKAKISDSNIYSCWQLNELAGTIRIVVEKKFELNFNHTIMLFGIVVIMGTFLYVFVKVIAGRKYAKT